MLYLSTRPYGLGDFDQPNAIGDGWVIPQTQESHNTTSIPVRHRPYPYAIVPKTPLRVGCGCMLYCMETRCIGCMLQLYIDLASSRLARYAIQPIQLYSYTAIQLYTLYSIQHYTASLRVPRQLPTCLLVAPTRMHTHPTAPPAPSGPPTAYL